MILRKQVHPTKYQNKKKRMTANSHLLFTGIHYSFGLSFFRTHLVSPLQIVYTL